MLHTYNHPHGFHQPTEGVSRNISAYQKKPMFSPQQSYFMVYLFSNKWLSKSNIIRQSMCRKLGIDQRIELTLAHEYDKTSQWGQTIIWR